MRPQPGAAVSSPVRSREGTWPSGRGLCDSITDTPFATDLSRADGPFFCGEKRELEAELRPLRGLREVETATGFRFAWFYFSCGGSGYFQSLGVMPGGCVFQDG